jgi:hypothetical protein
MQARPLDMRAIIDATAPKLPVTDFARQFGH